jgi:hypothetical protein
MKPDEIALFKNRQVVVTLTDGTRRVGRLMVTPEPGLYHVMRDPERPGKIVGGFLEDIWIEQIEKIGPLR